MAESTKITLDNKTMLRFFPDNTKEEHYTAIYNNGKLYEVKSPDNREKKYYDSIESWLESLPGTPNMDAIKCDKYTKALQNKYKRNVTKWTDYIYKLMKKCCSPSLFSSDPLINAFNSFTDCLIKYRSVFYRNDNYFKGFPTITLNFVENGLRSYINGFVMYPSAKYDSLTVLHDVYNTYLPLYNLIAPDILPYIEKKQAEYKILNRKTQLNKDIRFYNNRLNKCIKKRKLYEENMMHRLNCYNKEIDRYNSSLKKAEEEMKNINNL
jgi:hypothetical protein